MKEVLKIKHAVEVLSCLLCKKGAMNITKAMSVSAAKSIA
jgi:hypothetical protein